MAASGKRANMVVKPYSPHKIARSQVSRVHGMGRASGSFTNSMPPNAQMAKTRAKEKS